MLMKSSRRQPTNLKGMLTRQVVDYYLENCGLQPDQNWAFMMFGLFRLAVIAQQIYYRYYHQQTDNPAFKGFLDHDSCPYSGTLKLIALNNAETSG